MTTSLCRIIVLVGLILPCFCTPSGNQSGCASDQYFDSDRGVCLDLCGVNLEERCEVDAICSSKSGASPACVKQCKDECDIGTYCHTERHMCLPCDLLCSKNEAACRIHCYDPNVHSRSSKLTTAVLESTDQSKEEGDRGISFAVSKMSLTELSTDAPVDSISSTTGEKLTESNESATSVWKTSWIAGAGVFSMILIGIGQLLATVFRRRNNGQEFGMPANNQTSRNTNEVIDAAQPVAGCSQSSVAAVDLAEHVAYKADENNSHIDYESVEENKYEEIEVISGSDGSSGNDVTAALPDGEDDAYLQPVVENATPLTDQSTQNTPEYITVV